MAGRENVSRDDCRGNCVQHDAALRAIALAIVAIVLARCTSTSPSDRVIPIARPTVIAFTTAVSDADRARLTDDAIVLEDFEASWQDFTEWAKQVGIETEHVERPQFMIRATQGVIPINSSGFGYVLVEPSGRHKVLRGVVTDIDLRDVACQFFSAGQSPSMCGE
jgi:hypothetical protein